MALSIPDGVASFQTRSQAEGQFRHGEQCGSSAAIAPLPLARFRLQWDKTRAANRHPGGRPMCQIFASQLPESYCYVTRSVRLNGCCTSVRLEAKFWTILEEIARGQGMALPSFLSALHDEAEAIHGEVKNFASLLRCTCLVYLTDARSGRRTAPGRAPVLSAVG
jgi:predicted DNA-binding ribbon-helix-helix protein